jgi:hypothetical protein
VNPAYLADSVQYQTRVGVYDDYDEDRVISSTNVVQTYSAVAAARRIATCTPPMPAIRR